MLVVSLRLGVTWTVGVGVVEEGAAGLVHGKDPAAAKGEELEAVATLRGGRFESEFRWCQAKDVAVVLLLRLRLLLLRRRRLLMLDLTML
jgi:hypothetical protein